MKKWVTAIGAIILSVSLTACGGGQTTSDTSKSSSVSKETETKKSNTEDNN